MPDTPYDEKTIEVGKWLHGELTPVSSKYRPAIRAAAKIRADVVAEVEQRLREQASRELIGPASALTAAADFIREELRSDV